MEYLCIWSISEQSMDVRTVQYLPMMASRSVSDSTHVALCPSHCTYVHDMNQVYTEILNKLKSVGGWSQKVKFKFKSSFFFFFKKKVNFDGKQEPGRSSLSLVPKLRWQSTEFGQV